MHLSETCGDPIGQVQVRSGHGVRPGGPTGHRIDVASPQVSLESVQVRTDPSVEWYTHKQRNEQLVGGESSFLLLAASNKAKRVLSLSV